MREPTGSRERRGAASVTITTHRKKARITTLQQVSDNKGAPHPKADAAVLSGIFAAAGRHRIEIAGARLPMKMELAE
jgi:hypothetical protein